MVDKWIKTALAIMAITAFVAWTQAPARAGEQWSFGADLGFLADTLDDDVFTLSAQADYQLNSRVTIGPQLLISPGSDLTQVTLAGIARYHIPVGAVSLIPFGGLGFVYADLDRGRVNDDDLSYTLPFGVTAAFHINRKVSMASTLIMTFQDLDVDRRASSDNFNIGMLFGFRFQP